MEEIPVYLFTGFMDSGKTSLILETLFENDFTEEDRGLIIACEDGDVEYDEEKLAGINVKLATIDEEEDFNAKTLETLNETYKPQVIFIEYNGTWGMDTLKETELPKGCAFCPRCEEAMKICIEEQPPEMQMPDGHFASCWLNVKAAMEEENGGRQ